MDRDQTQDPGATAGSYGKRQRASIYDVAKRAGVSHMTVSRVLNGHPNIRESTRQRVEQAIEEMNYTRNSIARALATSRAMRIGVLVDGPFHFGPSSTLRALERSAHEHGYSVSSYTIGDDENQLFSEGLLELVTQGVDGVCVIAPRLSSLDILRKNPSGLPALVIKADGDPDLLTTAVDQRGGTASAVRHLMDLGHRDIVHLAGPLDWHDARVRAEAWHATLAGAGLPTGSPMIGDWSADSGHEFGRTQSFDEVTAVFASNDQMALGIIHGLAERGIRVPEDVSVVGFDDVPEARHYSPPLTTVRQDFAALGQSAISQLMAVIRGEGISSSSLIKANLVVRNSTGPVRG